MEKICLTCINGIYAAIYGHMNMVFTQDINQSYEVGKQLGYENVTPYWYPWTVKVNAGNWETIKDTIYHMAHVLGDPGFREFVSLQGIGLDEEFCGQDAVFIVQGFVI